MKWSNVNAATTNAPPPTATKEKQKRRKKKDWIIRINDVQRKRFPDIH